MTDDNFDTNPAYRWIGTACALLAVALLLVVAITGTTAAAQPTNESDPAFSVRVAADGSAQVALSIPFDLTTDAEGQAFEALRSNVSLREQRTEQFATRMRNIASVAAAETGRDMDVHNGSMSFTERNATGFVTLSVTWDNLAARQGDRLVVAEPFESGFTVDRQFRVAGPDGYELANATPSPSELTGNGATWSAGAELDGFETVFAPRNDGANTLASPATDTGGGDGPGFGVGVAFLAAIGSLIVMSLRDS